MLISFTDKSIRKTLLSSLIQQRADLTAMQPMILCPRNSKVHMYFDCQMGLMVQQTTLEKPICCFFKSIHCQSLCPATILHCSFGDPHPGSSPLAPPYSSSPSIVTNGSTKCKHSACQSVGSLPTFGNANDFVSVSDADMSSHSQTGTNSKQQKVNRPLALLSTSEKLKDFNNTIKDLMKSKEANKRQEWASSSECQMKTTALQEQESSWMSFDHLIAMIDHFKLDIGAADTYMSIQQPMPYKLWVKKKK